MAKDKSLGSNPALEFHKKAKKAGINKSKAEKAKLRDSQLQKRRPDQVQRQIDELRQLAQAGKINSQDKKNLDALERDLARINKLRVEGKTGPVVTSERIKQREEKEERKRGKIPKDPTRSYYYDPVCRLHLSCLRTITDIIDNPYGVPPPGMPYREIDKAAVESDSSTSSSIRRIPLPPGTPPPLGNTINDRHAAKEDHQSPAQSIQHPKSRRQQMPGRLAVADPQDEAVNVDTVEEVRRPVQTSYSAEPVMKDLQKEALAFVPKNLKRKAVALQKQRQIDPLDIEAIEEQELAQQASRESVTEAAQSQVKPVRKRINAAPNV